MYDHFKTDPRILDVHKTLHQDQMARAAHGQKLGKALNDP